MVKARAFTMLLAPAAFMTGCVGYRPEPLGPEAELARLRGANLGDFTVKHATPGDALEPSSLHFDPADGLDENEVVAIALSLNPDLESKRLDAGAAGSVLIGAGLWPNPELGLEWKPGIGSAKGHTVEGSLLFGILKPWERSARIQAATALVAEVEAEIIAAEWRVVRDTRQSLLTVLAREQEVALLREEAGLREHALELVKRSREAGESNDLEVSAAELELAENRRDTRRAETNSELARRELNQTVGFPPSYALPLADAGLPLVVTVFDDISDDEVDRRLLTGRFELRALEAAYVRAEHELRLAVYRQYPDLKVGPAFSREPEGSHYLGLGLALELPILNQNQGEIAEKLNQRVRARASFVAALHRIRAEAANARTRLQRARVEVETQEKEILPLIRRNQELFEGAFRARELNVLDWVAAQQRALRARQAYLDSLTRYREAVIELEVATGVPLAQAVERP
jgi:cobalt-zinc-cadmium efflux system outer membrane protein